MTTKSEIITQLNQSFNAIQNIFENTDETIFFTRVDSKWSVAENLQHLILSVNPLNKVFTLPRFALRYFGKMNRAARSYDEIVARYHTKLVQGGVASAAFVPVLKTGNDKSKLILDFKRTNDKFVKKVNDWNESDLDTYILPHPLLGKISIREMLYFTIYHTQHHHAIVKKITAN